MSAEKKHVIFDHPRISDIRDALVPRLLGRRHAIPLEDLCEKFNIRRENGSLAVSELMRFEQKLKKALGGALEAAHEQERMMYRDKILGMFEKTFEVAATDHEMAMSQTKIIGKGRQKKEVPSPDFDAAKGCREDMNGVSKSLAEIALPKELPEAQQQGGNLFTGNKIIMAMPKTVPSRPPLRVIEAAKEA